MRRLAIIIAVAFAGVVHAAPTAVFVYRVSMSNVSGHITFLDHPAVNGRPSVRLIVTPSWNPDCGGGIWNDSPIGVYYEPSAGRWAIFNERTTVAMSIGAGFNVKVFDASATDAILHTTTAADTTGNASLTPLALTHGKSLVTTPNWNAGGTLPGVYVTTPVGFFIERVGSDPTGRWFLALQNAAAAMPLGASFNIALGGTSHTASSFNTSGTSTLTSINDPYSLVFATANPYPTWGPVFHDHPIGVWWSAGARRWGIFDEDGAAMPLGTRFSVQFHRQPRIAFVSDRGGARKIHTASYDGNCVQAVTTGTNEDRVPVLNPAGTKIVFKRFGAFGTRWDLFSVNLDGTGLTRLMTPIDPGAYHDYTRPAWSPDGTLIAYIANSDLGPASLPEDGLHVVRPDGTGDRLLSARLGSGSSSPRFSPDSTRLVYDAFYPRSNSDIYVINVDGTGERNLTNSAAEDYDPSFSPDGRTIVFASRPTAAGTFTIATMDDAGAGVRDLTPGSPRQNRFPFFSPDGSTIAWLSYLASASMTTAELWLMNADGTNQRRLVAAVTVEPNPGVAFTVLAPPVFSPDGRAIFYVAGGEVHRIDVDGSSLTNITRTSATEWDVDIR